MLSRNHWAFLVVPALCLHSSAVFGDASDLSGCWKGESVAQFLADGSSKVDQSGHCILEFTPNSIHSRCAGKNGTSEIDYRYRVLRPGVYAATMTSHNFRPDLVGGEREYEYKIEGDQLQITTNPQTTKPSPPTAAVRVVSMSRKVPC
jgi:hypothetical protein